MYKQVRVVVDYFGSPLDATGELGQCRSCKAEVVFVRLPNGKEPPYELNGMLHNLLCPDRQRWHHRGRVQKEAT